MSASPEAPPLDLREVFSRPWEGEAVLSRPWWLRWLPVPSRFAFRTEIANLRGDAWDVRDTTTFPNGRQTTRTMHCRRVTADRLHLTADDMPDGADISVDAGGFRFDPYRLRTPVLGPLTVPLRFYDDVRLEDDETLLDTIEMRFLGIRVGTVTMQLRKLPAGD